MTIYISIHYKARLLSILAYGTTAKFYVAEEVVKYVKYCESNTTADKSSVQTQFVKKYTATEKYFRNHEDANSSA